MARVIALLAVIFGVLVGGSPASAIEPPTDVSSVASAYDAPIYDQASNYTATERGPPMTHDHAIALRAVDRRSYGPSARPETAGTSGYTTYDPDARLVRAGSVGASARESHGTLNCASSSLQPSRVAAKTEGGLFRGLVRDERGSIGLPDGSSRLTNSQVTDMANRLGFRPTNFKSKRQIVFTDGKSYITQDIDAHSGGLWKMARTPESLASKSTRSGTYDYDLNYLGP